MSRIRREVGTMSVTRRARLLSILLLACPTSIGRGETGQPDLGPAGAAAVKLVAQWRTAVEAHQPGDPDDPAYAVAAWPAGVFEEVVPFIETFLQLLAEPARRTFDQRTFDQPRRRLTTVEIEHLRKLVPVDATPAAAVDLRQRGALLHADIAMLVQPTAQAFTPLSSVRRPVRSIAGKPNGRIVVRAPDADYRGLEYSDVHFELARALLDRLAADPSQAAMVRHWYRATAAYFAESHQFAELTPHLERGLQLFPSDPHLLFTRGCHNETLASPGVQTFVATTTLPGNLRLNVDSTLAHLRRAGESFTRVLELNPGSVEARVRLGRVRSRLDQHADAAAMLRGTLELAADPVVGYYAHLFLGEAERALGRDQPARVAFEAAAQLFPRAQTPRLALSQLARRNNDAAGAAALLTFLTTSTQASPDDDPWWVYDRGEGRYVKDLLEQLWEPFRR